MAANTTVPITITEEAADRIRQLGMQAEFDRMIEFALQAVPGIRSFHVHVTPPYDIGYDMIEIEATVPGPAAADGDPATAEWDRWQLTTFPPEVHMQFLLSVVHEASP